MKYHRTQRKSKVKIVLLIFLGVFLLLAGASYPAYRSIKAARDARLVQQARHQVEKGNARGAALYLKQILKKNPRDLEAVRLMAQVTEAARSPAAILWRSRVVELDPQSLDDRLALAQTAMLMRDVVTATNALEGVNAAGRQTAKFQNVAGTIAATLGQSAQAEEHLKEAARLDPQDAVPRLNLAVMRLAQTNASARAEARAELDALGKEPTNPALRRQALRELIVDSMRNQKLDQAQALAQRLMQEPSVAFSDHVLRLEVLRQVKSPDFKTALAATQSAAGTNAAQLYELSMWELPHNGPAETLQWLRTLPKATLAAQPAAAIVAECYLMLQDWRGLQAAIDGQNWMELEFIRHAFLARALRGQDLGSAAKAEWEFASKAANGQKAALGMLVGLTARWGWQTEAEETLWALVNRYPDEKWATEALARALFIGGRTRSLMALFGQMAKANPADLSIKNNLAMTALLLDAQELKPFDLARQAYEAAPKNPSFVSTYAFALHVQAKNAEALRLIESLSPRELETPSIAAYYGVVLEAAGNKTKARKYLDLAAKAPLLPEERQMIDRARAGA